jgi:hypothetical protein
MLVQIFMNKQEFVDMCGENPEDMFGPDWRNQIGEYDDDETLDDDDEDINKDEELDGDEDGSN